MNSTVNGELNRTLDVRRDSADLRDIIYQPKLMELPERHLPARGGALHLLDQGKEGACTGFGLATMINFTNQGRKGFAPVSPRMLYEMARRYDQWPGEDYDGSSARGAMKGWAKHGVCPEASWPYVRDDPGYLTAQRRRDALGCPLGAYYRVLKRRSDLHSAILENGAVYVSAAMHSGWNALEQGVIPMRPVEPGEGGHAFCVIGYTEEGFLIQNSWGPDWGGIELEGRRFEGCALWRYADFDLRLWDAWVARPARPVESLAALRQGSITHDGLGARRRAEAPPQGDIADHYVHIDDGQFDPKGNYPSTEAEVGELIGRAVTAMAGGDGKAPGAILLYAHGGLNSIKGAACRVAGMQPVFEANRVHQIHFIWETGIFAELRDILLGKNDFAERRAGGFGSWKDDWIERATQPIGYALWKEMRDDAEIAFAGPARAGSRFLGMLKEAIEALPASRRPTLHLVGHSAGAIWMGHLLEAWGRAGGPAFDTLHLLAPACTIDFFKRHIHPALRDDTVKRAFHFQLDDETERDDHVAWIYGKSLLYLVSRSYQSKRGVVPLMGLKKDWDKEHVAEIATFNTEEHDSVTRSDSHGGFDDDPTTMNSVLRNVLGGQSPGTEFSKEGLKRCGESAGNDPFDWGM